MLAGMIANRKKLLRTAVGDAARGSGAALEVALTAVARDLAVELAERIHDVPQFAAYFRRYAREVAYDFVELQKRKAH